MSLNKDRLKGKILAAFKREQQEKQSADASAERFSEALATAIIEEIKEAGIEYISGLTAGGSAVTGTFENKIS